MNTQTIPNWFLAMANLIPAIQVEPKWEGNEGYFNDPTHRIEVEEFDLIFDLTVCCKVELSQGDYITPCHTSLTSLEAIVLNLKVVGEDGEEPLTDTERNYLSSQLERRVQL